MVSDRCLTMVNDHEITTVNNNEMTIVSYCYLVVKSGHLTHGQTTVDHGLTAVILRLTMVTDHSLTMVRPRLTIV